MITQFFVFDNIMSLNVLLYLSSQLSTILYVCFLLIHTLGSKWKLFKIIFKYVWKGVNYSGKTREFYEEKNVGTRLTFDNVKSVLFESLTFCDGQERNCEVKCNCLLVNRATLKRT